MHISLVQASVKRDLGQSLEKIYNDTILKTLGKTPGCIFEGLLLSLDQNRQLLLHCDNQKSMQGIMYLQEHSIISWN